MTKSLLPQLLDDLERYLDRQSRLWAEQAIDRHPTLPSTADGKVNVRAITIALGRPQSQEQHLFRRLELKSAINAVAIEQGLKPIGDRLHAHDVENVTIDRARRLKSRTEELSKLVAEQASLIDQLRAEVISLREQIDVFAETGQVLRTGLVR